MKRKRPKNGDVFEIQISEGMLAYGQLVEGNVLGCYIFYDVISEEHLSLQQIANSPILMLTFTVDQKIVSGERKIIGNATVPETVCIPEFRVDYMENGSLTCKVMKYDGTILRETNEDEKKKLSTMKSYTPNIIENVIKAKFGYIPWDNSYDQLIYRR